MIFKKTKIKDLILIKTEPFKDNRGLFRRIYCINELQLKKINFKIKQVNISENKNSQTLRGFHFQKFPYGDNKILTCIKGKIHNIVVDMRKNSKTYMKWQSFSLSEQNRLGLLVPKGCANAYLTMEKNTWVLYFHSQFYKPGYEKSINYKDPKFKFDWPKKANIISEKDNLIEFIK